jgi:hypothetical protein
MSVAQPVPHNFAGRLASLPRWALILLAALVLRAVTFGNPTLHVDETFYLETADAMLHGAVPYADVWDRKPIGLFLLYAIPAAFGVPGGIWVYQLMALAAVVLTALGIARLATRAGWESGATRAAIAYLAYLNLFEGQGGQAPVFYNLLVVGAVLLAAPREDDAAHARRRFGHGLAAMTLVGVAIQIKYSVVFEGLFLGLWLMWREWKLGRGVAATAALGIPWAGVALLPTAAAGLAYYAIGHWDAWLFANFTSILARHPDPLLEQLWNLFKIALIISPLAAMCILGWMMPRAEGNAQVARRFLYGWLMAAVLGLLVFGSWFDHYALPLLCPGAACAAGFLGEHKDGRRWAPWILAVVALGGLVLMAKKFHDRGTTAEYNALAAAVGKGPGCLYVYSGPSLLYSYSGRCRVTRWIFPSHLSRLREAGAIGTEPDPEIRRIFAEAKPEVVVMRPPYHGENAPMRALTSAELAKAYRLDARLKLGWLKLEVYKRR